MRGTYSKHQSLLVCLAPSALGSGLELNIRSRYESAYAYYFGEYFFFLSENDCEMHWPFLLLQSFFSNVFSVTFMKTSR